MYLSFVVLCYMLSVALLTCRIVGASDDSKADVAARMVTGVKLYVVGSVEDAVSVL